MSDVVDTLFLKEFDENNDLKFSKALKLVLIWGRVAIRKRDEFSEKFQTAFDPPPHFRKIILRISRQKCVCSYGGTFVYFMILFPMRCM